jgi:hypothetical protein
MQMLRKFIQWLLVGLSAVWLIASVAVGDFLSALLMTGAVIILAPPTKRLLAPKLPKFLNTVLVQFVLWFLCWAILIATLPPVEPSHTRADQPGVTQLSAKQSADLFNAQIDRYVSIPNLKEAPSSNAKIDGKVLVILKSSSVLSGEPINETSRDFMAFVPEALRPQQPSEVKYIAWMDCIHDEVGRYTNGARGYQRVCNVSVIDKASSTIIAKSEEFRGSMPPQSTRITTFNSGDLPEDEIKTFLASLIQQS